MKKTARNHHRMDSLVPPKPVPLERLLRVCSPAIPAGHLAIRVADRRVRRDCGHVPLARATQLSVEARRAALSAFPNRPCHCCPPTRAVPS